MPDLGSLAETLQAEWNTGSGKDADCNIYNEYLTACVTNTVSIWCISLKCCSAVCLIEFNQLLVYPSSYITVFGIWYLQIVAPVGRKLDDLAWYSFGTHHLSVSMLTPIIYVRFNRKVRNENSVMTDTGHPKKYACG